MNFKESLTEIEIEDIEAFCKNKKMCNAVKKVLLAGIYQHGTVQAGYVPNPLQNAAFNLASLAIDNPIPDEVLGQHIRSMWAGVNSLENAFQELFTIRKKTKETEEEINKAI